MFRRIALVFCLVASAAIASCGGGGSAESTAAQSSLGATVVLSADVPDAARSLIQTFRSPTSSDSKGQLDVPSDAVPSTVLITARCARSSRHQGAVAAAGYCGAFTCFCMHLMDAAAAEPPEIPSDCVLREDTHLDGLPRSVRSLRQIRAGQRGKGAKEA